MGGVGNLLYTTAKHLASPLTREIVCEGRLTVLTQSQQDPRTSKRYVGSLFDRMGPIADSRLSNALIEKVVEDEPTSTKWGDAKSLL
jgi:predicted TPR repeat methyltransferase